MSIVSIRLDLYRNRPFNRRSRWLIEFAHVAEGQPGQRRLQQCFGNTHSQLKSIAKNLEPETASIDESQC